MASAEPYRGGYGGGYGGRGGYGGGYGGRGGYEASDLVGEENVATLGHFRRQTPSQIDLSTVGKIFYFPELRCSVLNV